VSFGGIQVARADCAESLRWRCLLSVAWPAGCLVHGAGVGNPPGHRSDPFVAAGRL